MIVCKRLFIDLGPLKALNWTVIGQLGERDALHVGFLLAHDYEVERKFYIWKDSESISLWIDLCMINIFWCTGALCPFSMDMCGSSFPGYIMVSIMFGLTLSAWPAVTSSMLVSWGDWHTKESHKKSVSTSGPTTMRCGGQRPDHFSAASLMDRLTDKQ